MNKGYIYLALCGVFFIISLGVFTTLNPVQASTGCTQPYPIINLFVTIAGITLMCVSLAFFTLYYRNVTIEVKK